MEKEYYTEAEVNEIINKLNDDINLVFVLVSSIFIFLMQMGFAMLEAGNVRTKNSSNILLKNMLDTYVGAIIFYLVGYSFANDAQGGIIGQYHLASTNFDEWDYLNWIHQYSVCSNVATIVAGSLAERTFVDTYMFFAFLMVGLIYPITAAWIWGGGWLHVLGFHDFAGAGVVHLLGGVCGLIGTILLGPRLGIFGHTQESNNQDKMQTNRQKSNNQQEQKQMKSLAAFPNYSSGGDLKGIIKNFVPGSNSSKLFDVSDSSSHIQKAKSYPISEHSDFIEKKISGQSVDKHMFQERKESENFDKNEHSSMNENSQNNDLHRFQLVNIMNNNQQSSSSISVINSPAFAPSQDDQRVDQKSKFFTLKLQEIKELQYQEQKDSKSTFDVRLGAGSYGSYINSPRLVLAMKKIKHSFPEFKDLNDRQMQQIIKLYDMNIKNAFRPSSFSLIVQGTFWLWICWLFFHAGAANGVSQNKQSNQPQKIVMNTIISSAGSCISVLFLRPLIQQKADPTNKYPVKQICNALLAGLVSITGSCNNVQPWAALIIGILGTVIYCLTCRLFDKLRIDDPLEASQIHAFCGLWGVLNCGIFDNDTGLIFTGDFHQLLYQFIGSIAIIGWASITSFLYFYCLKKFNKFRVGYIYEVTGMDILMHGGTDLLSNEIINKIETKQRRVANRNHKD